MASLNPNGLASANTIRQQHQRLHSLLEAIENRFRHEQKASRNLVSLLNALAVHLQTHFELEESEGYLSNLVQLSPASTATVERLLREHRDLQEEVNGLVARTREDFAINRNTTELAERFGKFHSKLSAHDHEENKLIQETYNLDLGTKD
jgi:DNA repair ATPase RecN